MKQDSAPSGATRSGVDTAEIASLDGLRAVAFAIVFVSHAGLGKIVPGGFGVTVFFFLSGYLITTLMRREFNRTGHISLYQFYLRRTLRIFPPAYITLAICIGGVLLGVLPGQVSWAGAASLFGYYNNYWQTFGGTAVPSGTGIYWSLCIEEHFYLVFPLLCVVFMARLPRQSFAALLAGICLLVLAWRCYLIFGLGVSEERTYYCTDTRIDSILFGCLLAVWQNPVMDPVPALRDQTKVGLLLAALAALAACLLVRSVAFRETFRYTLQGIALMPIFYFAILHPKWIAFRWLGHPAIRFAGLLSYSLYLCHLVIIRTIEHYWPSTNVWIMLPLAGGLSWCYALAMYHAVEQPCARLRRRLHTGAK